MGLLKLQNVISYPQFQLPNEPTTLQWTRFLGFCHNTHRPLVWPLQNTHTQTSVIGWHLFLQPFAVHAVFVVYEHRVSHAQNCFDVTAQARA